MSTGVSGGGGGGVCGVIISMMPKGVEHRCMAAQCKGYTGVIISMMPKGVEHFCSLGMKRNVSR